MSKFILTCGDINGIGPEICIKALNSLAGKNNHKYILIIPANVFKTTSSFIKPRFRYSLSEDLTSSPDNDVTIVDLGEAVQQPGLNTSASGLAAYKAIERSYQYLIAGYADAVITAPISKTAINMAGIDFPGHTEMYASWCGVKDFVMVFLSHKFNAALLTIHVPIKDVPSLITGERIIKYSSIVCDSLKKDLAIPSPRLAVLGLNPHAGESGIIGMEEVDTIIPALKEIPYADGPFSPDAFFANGLFEKYDIVIGMYHDQVLIPFKMFNFQTGVNYTAGLPIVRTSPDHGTAFDIAGKGIADETSMIEATTYAALIVQNRLTVDAKG